MESITIYKDNSALFNRKGDIEIQKIHSCENLIDLFKKSSPKENF